MDGKWDIMTTLCQVTWRVQRLPKHCKTLWVTQRLGCKWLHLNSQHVTPVASLQLRAAMMRCEAAALGKDSLHDPHEVPNTNTL